jgi:hypothetical protein
MKSNKDVDTVKQINVGDKQVQALQISPDTRFISYRLYNSTFPHRRIPLFQIIWLKAATPLTFRAEPK